jgi:ABC-type Zn uptake system ZnuABC Zn-binding protein ZnuA
MKSRLLLLQPVVILAAFALLLVGCSGNHSAVNSPWKGTSKLKILTTIVPLYCLTANIAGDDAEVFCLMTVHGPHDFQPTEEDTRLLSEADLFIANGLGLEDFLDGMLKNADNKRLKVVRAGNYIPVEMRIHADGKPHYHGDKLVTHTGADPHVWLGVDEAKYMVDGIASALADRDATHAEGYQKRASETKQRLDKLQEFAKSIPQDKGGLVTFHDSFRYFGRSLHINIAGTIRDVRGEHDISPAALREQAEEFKRKGVRVIGVEPQYPRGIAQNLAKEIDPAKTRLIDLDPLETGHALPGEPYRLDKNYYFNKMQENLLHLRDAFE